MEIVIHNLSNILAYIDDLLVHTKDHGKHLEVLDELFTRLRKHGLKINLPKSFFGAREVSYLGFKLTPDGIKPDGTTLPKSEPFSDCAISSGDMSEISPRWRPRSTC